MTLDEEWVAMEIFKSTFHPDDAANAALVAKKREEWPEDWRRAVRAAQAVVAGLHQGSAIAPRVEQ